MSFAAPLALLALLLVPLACAAHVAARRRARRYAVRFPATATLALAAGGTPAWRRLLPIALLLAAIAALALALDGFDGWLARRQQLVSDYGGRFDIEIDAVAVLALSLLAWRNAAPLWVLAIGGMRYLFLAAGLVCPGLGLAPTASDSGFAEWRRKVIGVIQHLVLIASLMPAMPSASARFACALALLLLIYSFAADAISGGNKE